MLTNLRTIHKPQTLDEAAKLLRASDVYPLYGSGASLIRLDETERRKIQVAVDLSLVVGNSWNGNDQLTVNGCTRLSDLETGAEQHPESAFLQQVAEIIREEAPLTLRNTLTFGDILMECRSDSVALALLFGLDSVIQAYGSEPLSMEQWFALTSEQRRTMILQSISTPHDFLAPIRLAFEKVSRTPSDAPLVGAIGFALGNRPADDPVAYVVLTGVAPYPTFYVTGMHSQISDYKGSADYRAEMARILNERVLAKAIESAQS